MTVFQLMGILRHCRDIDAEITVLCNGEEFPLRMGAPIITKEGGGAAPIYYAINVDIARVQP